MISCMQYRKIFLSNCIIGFFATLIVTWYLCFYITSPVQGVDSKSASKRSFEAMLDNSGKVKAEDETDLSGNDPDVIKAGKESIDVKKEIEDFSYSEEDDAVLDVLYDKKFISDESRRTFIFHKDGTFDGFFDSSEQYVTGYRFSISEDGGKRILRISDPSFMSYISYELSLDYNKFDLYYRKGDFHMRFDSVK